MQTNFSPEALADPQMARSNEVLRACVHCGFCTATCPTYQVLGDELDSPRGRIYLMKQMLESGRPADAKTVKHIDRCLSCLACMTTCPSGVHYMHLVDHAREYIEQTYRRPLPERMLRWLLAFVLPYPGRFRLALKGAQVGRPLAGWMPGRLKGMVAMAPDVVPPASDMDRPQVFPAEGERRMRVALMTGCAQRVLNTDINAATIRLLTRHGCEVVVAEGAGCCGALTHHMGKTASSHSFARANIEAWMREKRGAGLDAVVINTSGCGTTVKDYGHIFRTEALADDAAAVSAMTRDISEIMMELGLRLPEAAVGAAEAGTAGPEHERVLEPVGAEASLDAERAPRVDRPLAAAPEDGKAQGYDPIRTHATDAPREADPEAMRVPGLVAPTEAPGANGPAAPRLGPPRGLRVAYHAACSLQHGQQIKTHPKTLLKQAGFEVVEPVDAHLCCGSAGTYNLMQPEIAGQLKARKVRTLEAVKPDVIAAGNIGCMVQIGGGTGIPVVHTAELLDWATGGPRPRALGGEGG
jgi:glycolate oxidase iron-sulfur subunit